MVSKNQIKLVKSLHQKKYRNRHNLFVAEGIKVVSELVASDFKVNAVYSTDAEIEVGAAGLVELVSEVELKKMSALTAPNKVLGVFEIPKARKPDLTGWVLVLDDVRDPGNLGTIIRLCDWFGIEHLVCSLNTVDCYNPKTLQATMGSISRVNIGYTDLPTFLEGVPSDIYGAFMDGVSVYTKAMPESGILVMGNEANGVSKEVEALVSRKISIPQFGKNTTESLNVATATAILLNEIRRG
ncbi:TrmH family RNA methyltransferase [Zobellia galactanivorans]|uniref:tRNA/rRNA methyltransferase n=1 Tax=Zobellia galactanivorans (strain DSM 12802 / CCUG 47099 / CIP 106680 / NCIMB 13871 / Dsij) TaxID=63186 RepID=G0L1Z2_ZOBGA|nr:RNA methyltransferase [Zobellia galactanivorans]CAZ94828.1 tRNA/rRNA methyltransferase [Zobellia galactanivorans]